MVTPLFTYLITIIRLIIINKKKSNFEEKSQPSLLFWLHFISSQVKCKNHLSKQDHLLPPSPPPPWLTSTWPFCGVFWPLFGHSSGRISIPKQPPSIGYHFPSSKPPNSISISTCFKLKVSDFNLVLWIFGFLSCFDYFDDGSCCFYWIKNHLGDGSCWSWS